MWGSRSKKRVTFNPHLVDGEEPIFLKQRVSQPRPMPRTGERTLRWRKDIVVKPTWSSEFFRGLGNKASRALRRMSLSTRRSSTNMASSSSLANLARSRSVADHKAMPDSHRAEAIDDCIVFLNSSTLLRRSNSVSACC